VDVTKIPFVNKLREKQRQEKLARQAAIAPADKVKKDSFCVCAPKLLIACV
jgi:hypothetical protein